MKQNSPADGSIELLDCLYAVAVSNTVDQIAIVNSSIRSVPPPSLFFHFFSVSSFSDLSYHFLSLQIGCQVKKMQTGTYASIAIVS